MLPSSFLPNRAHMNTQILFQAIQRGTYHPDQHLPSTSSVRRTLLPQPTALPLVGRQQELARLHDALQNARQGRGNFILISGDSGIGKTRLVQEYLSLYPGLLTLQGVCHELES
ncbi:MAG: ATP-binding protein, partial [Candidatus Bathyarchaeota archaeon]